MLSNLLRVFITKQAINKVHEEQRKLLEDQTALSNRMAQTTDMEELKIYLKQMKQLEKDRILYYSKPIMAEETAANARAFFPIFILFFLFVEIGTIIMIGGDMIKGYALENEHLMFVLVAAYMCILLYMYIYITKYLENTMCLYYKDRICIKKYRKKDIVITYDEVKECINKQKIKVHNGRFEYPYKKGKINIYTWGNSVTDGFYKFINKECDAKMPKVEKKEKDVVRRTGIGWSLYFGFGSTLFTFDTIIMLLGCMSEYGIEFGMNFWKAYINYLFSWDNFFGVLALIFIVIGFFLKFLFYFPAKKYFKNFEDIKVSLF